MGDCRSRSRSRASASSPPDHHRHGQELGAEGAKYLHRARIRRLLDGHEVAGVEERPGDEVEPLLGAVDDEDLLGAGLETEAQQVAGQEFAQRGVAARGIVLQQLPPLLADHAVEHAAEGVGGEEAAVRHAPRERDQAGSGPRAAAPVLTAARVRRDDLGALGQEAGPVEARRGGAGRLRRGHLVRHEGALPHVRARPAPRHQLVIGEGHRRPIDAEVPRQLARRGQLGAGSQEALADQALDVELDLARQREPTRPIRPPVKGNPHMGHFVTIVSV